MTVLLELQAVVDAPPDRVADLLLDVRPGGRSPLAADGGEMKAAGGEVADAEADEFVVVRQGSRMTVTVDRAARSVALRGEWWYRGVTSVRPDPLGSRVVHQVFNVAEGHGWAVRFASRGPLNAAPRSFAETIRVLGERLGVDARVVD